MKLRPCITQPSGRFLLVCLLGLGWFGAPTLLQASPKPAPSPTWKVHKKVLLPQGTYQLESGQRYTMVGHLVKGRVSVVDLQTGTLLRSQSWGMGQVYIAQRGSYGVVALTSMRQLLLVSLPSLRVIRRHKVSFYPYGVSLEPRSATTKPSTRPHTKQPPKSVVVADQMGNALLRLNLQTGKVTKKQTFKWPLRSRWSQRGGMLIPLSGPVHWLHPTTWKTLHTWNLPGVVGDVAMDNGLLAVAYGDGKRQKGSLHLYQNLRKQLWKAPTKARPRGVAHAGSHTLTLTEKGWLQVYQRRDGRLLQTQRVSNSGLAVRCPNSKVCVGLLPLAHSLVIIKRVR
ncbi:MAG: hypothetical protein EP343_06965 [Deltaproteobacteria bacterium]|nr:MAG: hypothetical protein EP343_06965 [Deltaproteobacteria bacterium]